MKATVVALTLLLAGAGAVFAQTPEPATAGTPRPSHMDNLATLLDLTAAQKAQVQAILQDEHAKMKASFQEAKAAGTKPDFQQMRTLHTQLQQETLQRLTPVLSSAQLKKFQVLAQMQRHHFGHFHGGAEGAVPPPAQN
jgi:Spy/CpxP family protein refolding chaperone